MAVGQPVHFERSAIHYAEMQVMNLYGPKAYSKLLLQMYMCFN